MSARFGVGVGLAARDGFAAAYFGQVDAWPLPFLGVGIEGSMSGTERVALFEPDRTATYRAVRGRASLRWAWPLRATRANASAPSALVLVSGSFGLGPGQSERERLVEVPCPPTSETSCDGFDLSADYRSESTLSEVLTPSYELAVRIQWRRLEAGVFARLETWRSRGFFTLGPTLGVAF